MTPPILVGYDPRTLDHAPVHFGVAAAELTGAPLIVASVQAGSRPVAVSAGQVVAYAVAQQPDEDLLEDCTPALQDVEQELQDAGFAVECRKLLGTSAARALHQAAEAEGAALLVVGSTRRGPVGRVLIGSTAERVIAGSPCPIAVVPRRWTRGGGLSTIGVGFIDTEDGRAALRAAHVLARHIGARLRVLTVVQIAFGMYGETEGKTAEQRAKYFEDVLGEHKLEAMRAAERAVGELDDDVEVEVDAFIGKPGEVLAELSEYLDLLVCGSRGYGPVRAVLLGGVTRRLTADARCPVIVLPRGVETPLVELLAHAPGAAARV
jgi:nucleotide-binding universal stress UspA family protein